MCSNGKIERFAVIAVCITAFAISIVITNPWEQKDWTPAQMKGAQHSPASKADKETEEADAPETTKLAVKATSAASGKRAKAQAVDDDEETPAPTKKALAKKTSGASSTASASSSAKCPPALSDEEGGKSPCPKMPKGPKKKFTVGSEITHVIIDVGTNVNPEFGKYAKDDPHALYIIIEPLTVNEAQSNGCRGFPKSRCILIAAAVSNIARWAVFRVAATSACSSLLQNGTGCGQEVSQMFVSLITLDEVIDQLPDDLPIKMIAMDCQGADFYALASLKRHADRVMSFIVECQDLPLGDPGMIYGSESKNCGIIHDCALKQMGFEFVRCSCNVPHVREFNCVYIRPDAPRKWTDLARDMRHGMNLQEGDQELKVKGKCPMDEWKAMPTPCR